VFYVDSAIENSKKSVFSHELTGNNEMFKYIINRSCLSNKTNHE